MYRGRKNWWELDGHMNTSSISKIPKKRNLNNNMFIEYFINHYFNYVCEQKLNHISVILSLIVSFTVRFSAKAILDAGFPISN